MVKSEIQAFYNPRKAGDTSGGWGLPNSKTANRVISSLDEFLAEAGRTYYIKKVPALVEDPFGAIDEAGNFVPAVQPVEGQFHLIRSTDGKVVSPHTVTDQYAPLSLMDMAEEVRPWLDAGWVTPDSVFEARGGSLELLSLRIDGGEEIEAQKLLHYILFQNPHATGGTAKGKIITWRIVCRNTFAAAIMAEKDFAITHRTAAGDPETQKAIMCQRAADAVAAWKQVQEHFAKLAERIGLLNSTPMIFEQASALTDELLGIAGKDEEKVSTRAKNKKTEILRAFSMPQFGTFGRTAWDWLNAVTFVNSSPLADVNKKSKVSEIDRIVRNTDANGSGFKVEQEANKLLRAFVGS